MRKHMIVLFTVCLIAVFATLIFVWNTTDSQQSEKASGEMSLIRNFNTPDEEQAIATAETLDYVTITGYGRFDMRGSEDYKQPRTYISYVYAKFIDIEVIKYYQERYVYQQKQTSPKSVTLNYIANVTQFTNVSVTNDGGAIVIYDVDNSATLSTTNFRSAVPHVFYKSSTEYQSLQLGDNLNFSDVYFIEMKYQYFEYYASTAAWWADAQQIVILDQNLAPILICIYDMPQIVA
ncbi:MAG: hypothetical protein LBH62_00370 [Nitrososphaerota archaeon]|jgi:hypothetical protein|nr:hypothetical protein [Nitrososphaerota archaeon]